MVKDIYLIENLLNHKKYVGQSNNPNRRFIEHKNHQNNYPIHNAIQKYGVNNFKLTILEKNVENYNEREQYWIQYYNTLVPNGYNLTIGGEDAPIRCGTDNPKTSHSEKEIQEIKKLLKNTDMTFEKIADLYHYKGASSIGFINEGIIWFDETEKYPIRQNKKSKKISKTQVLAIINMLQNTNKTQQEIAKIFNIQRSVITAINLGTEYQQENITYPIRDKTVKYTKLSNKDVQEICNLLTNDSHLSFTAIAKKYKTSIATITNINYGKTYKNSALSYPLREK